MHYPRKAGTVLGIAAFSYAILPAVHAQNIVQNPGFESGSLGPWFQDRSFSAGDNWNVTSVSANTGTFSATEVGDKELRQNFAPLETANITQVSFYAKQISIFATSSASFNYFYSDGTNTQFNISTLTDSFRLFDVTSYLTPGKQLTGFSMFGANGGANQIREYLDDVVINAAVVAPAAVPEASTTVSFGLLFALGLGGALVAAKRKKITVKDGAAA